MLKRSGQAAGWLLHLLAEIVLGLVLLGVLATGLLAWRLAEGPIALGFLLPRITAAFQGGPHGPHVSVGAASLAWEGFRNGLESPLELALAEVVVTGPHGAGIAVIPRAEVSLSVPALLIGRFVPRRIVIEAPKLHLVRSRTGRFALAFGPRHAPEPPAASAEASAPSAGTARLASQILTALEAKPGNGRSGPAGRLPWLSQLVTLTIRDAELSVVDRALGATWYAPTADVTLVRSALGGLTANARLVLSLEGHQAVLTVRADLEEHRSLQMAARLSPVTPAELASVSPRLAPLAAVAAPVRLALDLAFAPTFTLQHGWLEARLGTGGIALGGEAVPIAGGRLTISGGAGELTLEQAVLRLAGPAGREGPVLAGAGTALRNPDGTWRGELSVGADAVPMAELARYWPPEIARGGRAWVTRNITAGTAENAHLTVDFAYAPGKAGLSLISAAAKVPGSGLVVHWLRPVAPLTDGAATLSLTDPDALTIDVQHAAEGALQVASGTVVITGLEQSDQNARITARVVGPLQSALALLAEPRLHLLARHPLEFPSPTGASDATLTIALPLLAKVTMDQVAVQANAALTHVRIEGLPAGHAMKEGTLSLTADNNGLQIGGSASVAGIPARLSYRMDFRAGPPGEVAQRIEATATATAAELARLGVVDVTGEVEGPLALSGNVAIARDGAAKAKVTAGLTEARLSIASLGFTKPPGVAASASAEFSLERGQIETVDAFDLSGTGIAVAGAADFVGGRPMFIRISKARLGRTEASGSVRFPGAGKPITVVLNGSLLDLSARFAYHAPGRGANRPSAGKTPPARTAPWILDARFARALLAHDQPLTDCVVHAESDGTRITSASLTGNLAPGAPLSLVIAPAPTAESRGRTLAIRAANAGDMLAATDITDKVRGGQLALAAHYDDTVAGRPLSGEATMSDFRVKDAPALGRVLQAMTLYGLAEVMTGPGLAFSKLVAPFRLAGDTLSLTDVRAFSPSLGLTLAGNIDLATRTANLSGTIVPAYFFNSLLGKIPLIGRLFSPEKGGGVFAADYRVDGPLDNPSVHVNPLAALTPGFLRGLFQIFD